MATSKLPIKHIGIIFALCNKRLKAYLREDLGSARYRQLGVSERFTNEAPYRICENCIRLSDAPWKVHQRRREEQGVKQ